ncbi:MAG: hypothetical protein U0228_09050 [Myxococcaceae bacterium]
MRSLLTLGMVVLLDVVPHCGPPRVVVREPGEDCGAHGPSWQGNCHDPAACFDFESGGAFCTVTCAADADCATLGAGFTCTGSGRPYSAQSGAYAKVCQKPTP